MCLFDNSTVLDMSTVRFDCEVQYIMNKRLTIKYLNVSNIFSGDLNGFLEVDKWKSYGDDFVCSCILCYRFEPWASSSADFGFHVLVESRNGRAPSFLGLHNWLSRDSQIEAKKGRGIRLKTKLFQNDEASSSLRGGI